MPDKSDSRDRYCSVCGQVCLGGVVPIEPRWFCPDHPDAEPVAGIRCPACNGRGVVISKKVIS